MKENKCIIDNFERVDFDCGAMEDCSDCSECRVGKNPEGEFYCRDEIHGYCESNIAQAKILIEKIKQLTGKNVILVNIEGGSNNEVL